MNEPDYRGVAALAIAICAAVGVFILTPIALIFNVKLGDGRILIALGGGLIGALAVYMGIRLGNGKEVLPTHKAPPKSAQPTEKDNDPQA
jgi:hypothetical protein